MPYDKDFADAVLDHIDTLEGGEGKDKGGTTTPGTFKNKTVFDDLADMRDILSEFAVKGYRGMNKDDAKAMFDKLTLIAGRTKAIKLINSIDIFQQRPESKVENPEDRMQNFYNMGSNDKDVAEIMTKIKGLGYGIKAGARASTSHGIQQIEGTNQPTQPGSSQQAEKIKDIAAQALPTQ